MNADELEARLRDLREKASHDWLRGVLDGVPKAEGVECPCDGPLVNDEFPFSRDWMCLPCYRDAMAGQLRHCAVDCEHGCGGTGRIGAKPAIEGLLVQFGEDGWDSWGTWYYAGDLILNPLVRQLADAGEEEAIVGMIERRLRALGAIVWGDRDDGPRLLLNDAIDIYYPLELEALLNAMEIDKALEETQ